jgi:hypothetical protein
MTATMSRRPGSAAQLLRTSPINELQSVVAVETDEEVVLVGVVRSYYLKQMAQELVRPAKGGRRLRNRLVVIPA